MLWSHNVPGSSKITVNISVWQRVANYVLIRPIRPVDCNNEFWSGVYIYSLCFGTSQLFVLCIHTQRVLFIVGSLCQMLTSLLVHPLDC